MAFTETDHIVIVVADIEAGIETWREQLGMTLSHRASVPEAGIHQAFFLLPDNTFIELIAPASENSAIQNIVDRRGEGVHVVSLKVDDLESSVAELQARGVKLIGVGTPQVFIHPKSANGVMIQLWPANRPHRWRDAPDPASPRRQDEGRQ